MGHVTLFMTGELHNRTALKQQLREHGHEIDRGSDIELVGRLYLAQGKAFIQQLQGAFIIAVWNATQQELILANDRFGLYPLLYAHYQQTFVFAPEMKAILNLPNFQKSLNQTALAEYMRFQQVLGQKTFFEAITLLRYASLLTYNAQTNRLTVEPYWDFSDITPLPHMSMAEATEEGSRLLDEAISIMAPSHQRTGVYLTGGMDSRLILGCLIRQQAPPPTITYGQQNSRDVVFARKTAKKVGSPHHWFDLPNGQWVADYADLHLTLTEGWNNWVHSHGITTLAQVREIIDVNLTGWMVDTSIGGCGTWWTEPIGQVQDETALKTMFYQFYNQKQTWPGITDIEERFLYTPAYAQALSGLAATSFFTELDKFSQYDFRQRLELFVQTNHNLRLTFPHLQMARSFFEVRAITGYYPLAELIIGIPTHKREHRALERSLLNHISPSLAMIPWSKDNILITERTIPRTIHKLATRLMGRVNQHLYPIFNDPQTLYADYESYLRTDLHDWAKAILFDERTLDRGIFNPDFLHAIWNRHQSGHELHTIGKIAPLMTYEMMLRRYYD